MNIIGIEKMNKEQKIQSYTRLKTICTILNIDENKVKVKYSNGKLLYNLRAIISALELPKKKYYSSKLIKDHIDNEKYVEEEILFSIALFALNQKGTRFKHILAVNILPELLNQNILNNLLRDAILNKNIVTRIPKKNKA